MHGGTTHQAFDEGLSFLQSEALRKSLPGIEVQSQGNPVCAGMMLLLAYPEAADQNRSVPE